MFNELMIKISGKLSDTSILIEEMFANCDSEEEIILLKKMIQDMINYESESRKDQL